MSPMLFAYHFWHRWASTTFGPASANDLPNRAARVAEEAIELAQCEGVPQAQVQKILERVYSRPKGERRQEAAGVFATLIIYAKAAKIDLWRVLNSEQQRVEKTDPEVFRAKQREKFAAGTDLVPPP